MIGSWLTSRGDSFVMVVGTLSRGSCLCASGLWVMPPVHRGDSARDTGQCHVRVTRARAYYLTYAYLRFSSFRISLSIAAFCSCSHVPIAPADKKGAQNMVQKQNTHFLQQARYCQYRYNLLLDIMVALLPQKAQFCRRVNEMFSAHIRGHHDPRIRSKRQLETSELIFQAWVKFSK